MAGLTEREIEKLVKTALKNRRGSRPVYVAVERKKDILEKIGDTIYDDIPDAIGRIADKFYGIK